jgi:(2Fe-2S) ferredoxin
VYTNGLSERTTTLPAMPQPYYKYHMFFCVNQRPPGEACCANHGSPAMREYAKQRVKALGLSGKGGVRVNAAGCLDRCQEGPTIVIYPDGVWYTYTDKGDIDEIVGEHLTHGRIVGRLRI